MPKTYRVLFKPDQVSVDVPESTTILAAANQAGVFMDGLCGGDGVCAYGELVFLPARVLLPFLVFSQWA